MSTKSNEELLKENDELKHKLLEMEETLKKYTNGERHQRYYEAHKDEVKAKAKMYMDKLRKDNPEKIKEWRQKAYLKKKENS